MFIKTRVFELCDGRYKTLPELALAMGIPVSQVNQVREGKRHINQNFITGAIKAFPEHKLDDLFYLAPRSPAIPNNCSIGIHQTKPNQERGLKQKERVFI